ncbi:MAG: response regulator [Actinobacteria bacterium]|nr:response regulator [Actinomycetota bacterium]
MTSEAEEGSIAGVSGEMIGMIGYAVRNPLHGAAGLLELLAGTDLDQDQDRMVRQALASLGDLGSTVDQLLDLARVEAGQLELRLVDSSMLDLVDYVVERTGGMARPGVEVAAVCPPYVPAVKADSYRIAQVLDILVNNATEAAVEGSVQVRLELTDPEGRPLSDNLIGLRFSVVDTGPGLPLEEVAQVLVPYWERSTPTPSLGMTTGLFLANRLVSLMGGKMSMATTPGRGTEVSFALLLERHAPAAIASSPRISAPLGLQAPVGFRPTSTEAPTISATVVGEPVMEDNDNAEGMGQSAAGHILVVEDNEVNRILAERQLTKLGYRVTSCSGGKDGVELALTGAFDAVLMDYQMPDVDGLEATRRIRQAESGRDRRLPIIAVTANATPSDHDACLRSGMDDYLAKPVDMQRLDQTLQRWVKRTVPGAQPEAPGPEVIVPGTVELLLSQLDGDREAVRRLYEQALDELPVRRMRILAAAKGANPADLVGAARALGASCTSLGVPGLASVCRDIEDQADRETPGIIDGCLERLNASCRRTESLFSATIRALREDSSPNVSVR